MQEDRGARRPGCAYAWTLLALAGCAEPLPPATGGTTDVLVLVDTPTAPDLGPLQAALVVPTPYLLPEEPAFLVTTRAVASPRETPREKNIVVVARTDGVSRLLPTLAGWLAAQAWNRLAVCGGRAVLADVWARDQEVILLVGNHAAGLDSLLRRAALELPVQLESSILERCARGLRTQTPARAEQLRRYGFGIAAPAAYRQLPAVTGVPAIELACEAPARVLTIFWSDGVKPRDGARDETLLTLQRNVLRRLHGDSLRVESMRPVALDAARREARGNWQNAGDVAGGPFIVHFVYDRRRERLYGVQGQLFAPGRRKRPFLVELEALLLTFRLEAEP